MKTKIYKLSTVLIIVLANLLLSSSIFAQIPQKFSYQAIIRDTSDNLVTNQTIGMQISILHSSPTGAAVFIETHTPNTNANGLISIQIGGGTPVHNTISNIGWYSGNYYIKTEVDLTGGTNYSITGTSRLLSVPYALYAETAESIGTHYVGELYGGGVVFWVDQTGNHGLICSMIDLSTSQVWSNIDATEIGATAQSDWDGNSNSTAITGQAGHTSSAAKLCIDYTNTDYGTGTYSDWYLPSRGELNDLWNSIKAVQKALDSDGNPATTAIIKNYYWSSSEYNGYSAWLFSFGFGYADYATKDYAVVYVRAVRAF